MYNSNIVLYSLEFGLSLVIILNSCPPPSWKNTKAGFMLPHEIIPFWSWAKRASTAISFWAFALYFQFFIDILYVFSWEVNNVSKAPWVKRIVF